MSRQLFPRARRLLIRCEKEATGYQRELVIWQWALVPRFAKAVKLPYAAHSEKLAEKAGYKHLGPLPALHLYSQLFRSVELPNGQERMVALCTCRPNAVARCTSPTHLDRQTRPRFDENYRMPTLKAMRTRDEARA